MSGHHMRWRAASAATVMVAGVLGAAPALAAPEAPGAPGAQALRERLAQAPGCRAAWQGVEAERAVHRQLQAGPGDWVLGASVQRLRDTGAGAGGSPSTDWELGLERSLRLPGKAGLHDALGAARVGLAQAGARAACDDAARQWVQDLGGWLRDTRSAAVWQAQLQLLSQHREAAVRRRQLGDAAPVDELQADAALRQARAQAEAAAARAEQARRYLALRHPGAAGADPAAAWAELARLSEPAGAEEAAQVLARHPELEAARRDTELVRAQAAVERADTRPDPTLGLRWGRARQQQEQTVALTLSLPLGGVAREAAAVAAARRAVAAELRLEDTRLRVQAELTRRREAWLAAQAAAQAARAALLPLEDVAGRLARGYALGEGSLADVLSARRLVNEQRLLVEAAEAEAAVARALVAIDTGAWAAD